MRAITGRTGSFSSRNLAGLHCSPRRRPRSGSRPSGCGRARRLRQVEAVYRGALVEPAIAAPASADQAWEPDAALVELVRGRLEGQGPTTLAQLAGTFGLPPERISVALTSLEVEGFALAG